jgi:hypothetical protein
MIDQYEVAWKTVYDLCLKLGLKTSKNQHAGWSGIDMVCDFIRIAVIKREGPCEWSDDGEGNWSTECGQLFVLIEGSPHQNGMRYCYHCGRKLKRDKAHVQKR